MRNKLFLISNKNLSRQQGQRKDDGSVFLWCDYLWPSLHLFRFKTICYVFLFSTLSYSFTFNKFEPFRPNWLHFSKKTHLILLNISPVFNIRRNWFSVVALWKKAVFSFTKNVSGVQMVLMYSAPTKSFSNPGRFSKASLGSVQNCLKYTCIVKSWKRWNWRWLFCFF